jgi:hypothetical protein
MHGQNLRICFNHCSCCNEKLFGKSGIIDEVKKILFIKQMKKWMKQSYSVFYKLHEFRFKDIMPMSISELGTAALRLYLLFLTF